MKGSMPWNDILCSFEKELTNAALFKSKVKEIILNLNSEKTFFSKSI